MIKLPNQNIHYNHSGFTYYSAWLKYVWSKLLQKTYSIFICIYFLTEPTVYLYFIFLNTYILSMYQFIHDYEWGQWRKLAQPKCVVELSNTIRNGFNCNSELADTIGRINDDGDILHPLQEKSFLVKTIFVTKNLKNPH